MKDRLFYEIKEKMDRFFETVSDDEFVAILDDMDWKHYATVVPPTLEVHYQASAKPSENSAPKLWGLRHRSVINKTPTQERLAA